MPWPLWLPWIVNNSLNISLDLAIWKDIKKKKMSCKRRKQEQNQTVLNTVKPASWHQAQETWMKDATCCSSTHSLQKAKRNIPWAQNWGHKFGSWATNFNIVAPFWGPESGPCFGATKHKQESIRAASVLLPTQADSSTCPWYSEGTALGPPRLWEKAPPMP